MFEDTTMYGKLKLRMNSIETTDDYIQLFGSQEWPGFIDKYAFIKDTARAITDFYGMHAFFFIQVEIADTTMSHTRKVYGMLDLFGDFGGLLEVLSILIALIVAPWAEY